MEQPLVAVHMLASMSLQVTVLAGVVNYDFRSPEHHLYQNFSIVIIIIIIIIVNYSHDLTAYHRSGQRKLIVELPQERNDLSLR